MRISIHEMLYLYQKPYIISDFKMTPMNCKDSESADDESSGDD